MTAPRTARLRALIANLAQNHWSPAQRQAFQADLDAELAALRTIEISYAAITADTAEQLLLTEPVAGCA